MSEADEKQMLPIALSGAIGALALADAFLITSDSDDMFKIVLGCLLYTSPSPRD